MPNENPKHSPGPVAPSHGGCRHTRRDFLRGAGYAAGAFGLLNILPAPAWADIPTNCAFKPTPPANAVPFTPDTSLDIKPRKSAFMLTAAEKTRLKEAYKKLRQLSLNDPNDPRGWMLQANVHCFYCGGASGTGQVEIHGGWWFFPWHRAYLYFHERILASLVGDPTFRLAYWDWNTVNSSNQLIRSTLPPVFTAPNNSTNALFDANRGVTPADKIPSQYISKSTMDPRMAAPNFSTFGGTNPAGPNPTGGSIEFGPHGAVHVWTGDVTMDWDNPKADMGILQTAAQDPTFFAHHSNIDRLWAVWNKSLATHTNPTSQTWLNQTWTFYDENKQWRSIKVKDVLDMENSLRYRYAAPQLLLSVIKPPVLSRVPVLQEIKTKVDIPTGTPTAGGPNTLGIEPQTKRVTLPTDFRSRVLSARAQPPEETPRRYFLHIEGIHLPPHKSAIVRVFANLPSATAATTVETPNFLDYFVIVAKSAQPGEHRHQPVNIEIDVTDKLPRLLSAGRDLSVTLVPVSGANRKPRGGNLTYERLYLSEKE